MRSQGMRSNSVWRSRRHKWQKAWMWPARPQRDMIMISVRLLLIFRWSQMCWSSPQALFIYNQKGEVIFCFPAFELYWDESFERFSFLDYTEPMLSQFRLRFVLFNTYDLTDVRYRMYFVYKLYQATKYIRRLSHLVPQASITSESVIYTSLLWQSTLFIPYIWTSLRSHLGTTLMQH
jgi:hypothetical protein